MSSETETPTSTQIPTEAELKDWLRTVEDPDLYISLIDLGLIYTVALNPEDGSARVKMTLTSPACPSGGYLITEVKKRTLEHPAVKSAEVELVWEPKWDPKTMCSDEVKEELNLW